MSYDLLILGGVIVDGSGAERRRADVAIKNGRIAKIGTFSKADGEQAIEADGLIVSPGFIDPHTHYDAQIFWDPTLSATSRHGVTTVVGGNCGFTLAPLTSTSVDYLVRMLSCVEDIPIAALQAGVKCDWTSVQGYRERLEGRIGINAGFSVGHSTLRHVVMGERSRSEKATRADLANMKNLLARCIAEGALGFSSSRTVNHEDHEGKPVPSRFAATDELIQLASVCKNFAGTILELVPGLEPDEESAHLMAEMSLAADRPLNWNLISMRDLSDAAVKRVEKQLAMCDYARARGAEVIGLTLPTSSGVHFNLERGNLFNLLEGWGSLFKVSIEERKRMLREPSLRGKLKEGLERSGHQIRSLADPKVMVVEKGMSTETAQFEGKTIQQVADLTGKPAFDVMLDLALHDGLKTQFTAMERGEGRETYEFRSRLWDDNRTIIGGSDAGAHVESLDSFAYFTRVLDVAVRKFGVISLEHAVQKMTQVPAQLLGLSRRGELKEGWHADITIFNEKTVARGPIGLRADLPRGATRLFADSVGIEYVIVNGTPILKNGEGTGALPGTLLKSGRDTATVDIVTAHSLREGRTRSTN